MTRINIGIPVRHLTDEHLLAEHREIKRLPEAYKAALRSGSIESIPRRFVLGKGHVLFFVDKPGYTLRRYLQIYEECLRRGFEVTYYGSNWDCYPLDMLSRTLRPTPRMRSLLSVRITERILDSPKGCFHYYGKRISKKDAIELLTLQK